MRLILFLAAVLFLMTNVCTYIVLSDKVRQLEQELSQAAPPPHESPDASAAAWGAGLKDFNVVNAHDHLYMRSHLDKYFRAAQKTGVTRTLFVASSAYTLLGEGHSSAEKNDWNSEEILAVANEFPDRIIPFCTIYPGDPQKLEKVKRFVAKGAKGLKLYSGHGNFHEKGPLDVADMLPVYAYCQETNLPICWHVNLMRYADEFRRVMERFPRLTVIIPHFGVAFYRPGGKPWKELEYLLDTYPNLYTDTSFGTRGILVHGLDIVGKNREVFRAFFEKYSDRIFFGTDMVVTGNKEKTEEWIEAVIRACRDVLEKDTYRFFMAAKGSPYAVKASDNRYGELRGLALDDDMLRRVYETNIEKLFPSS